MKMLNIACGSRYHKDWINIDIIADSPLIKKVNLLRGLPFEDNCFDVVYSSHYIEHLSEYNAKFVLKEAHRILKPGGILCLIDLDYNCLSHYNIPKKLKRTLFAIMKYLEEKANFDPYVGRKLYSFLYDLGYQDINVDVAAHHLIFGKLKDADAFNWFKKLEVVSRKINLQFEEYEGGYEEFLEDFKRFFTDPGRFTYTPVISCRGRKPLL